MATNGNGNNGNTKKRELTAQKIIVALRETKGLLTLAARKAGVSYRTINRYASEYPSVAEAVQEAKESMVDFAEGKLYEKIAKGDTASIIFFLKTKAKSRGYTERQEITGPDGGAVRMDIDARNAENKLLGFLDRISARGAETSGDPKP